MAVSARARRPGIREGSSEQLSRSRPQAIARWGRIYGVCVKRDSLARDYRHGLEIVIGEQSVDALAARAEVGALQVDVGGYTPGAVIGPPQARALVALGVDPSLAGWLDVAVVEGPPGHCGQRTVREDHRSMRHP